MSKLRAALIGTGNIARQHVRGLKAHADRADLVAVLDVDLARATAFAAEFGIAGVYNDTAKFLAESRADLVHICTPPSFHASLAIAAMEAGAHVLCEKPLCASLAELDLIQAAEKRTGRFCAAVFQLRHGSSVAHVRAAIDAQTLGRPLVALCQTLWFRNAAYYEVPWRGKWSNELGGPTVGHGIHAMDQLLYLLGSWRQLRAVARTLDRAIEVEDVSAALVDFENGCVASIMNSILSPRQETYLRLDFQKATVELKHLYAFSNDSWKFSVADGASAVPIAALSALPPDVRADHVAQVDDILNDIELGRVPRTAGDQARRTIELLTAIYKSSFTGQPVDRGSIVAGDPFYHSFHGGHQCAAR
jgi:predicted dehydrogenase